jgi:POT family proton-dependent oligopeptide transporter
MATYYAPETMTDGANVPAGDAPASEKASALADVDRLKQLGLGAAIAGLGYVFWIVGAMEMVERLAYYGVKAVAALYAKDPASVGGLGVTMSEFGDVLASWALVQSIVPALTGGLSDRYGYKETIFVSTWVKIAGYLTMGLFPSFAGFFAGAVILAIGTAIFKPGIRGTLVKATRPDNTSMAWGIFYQTVNIGGYIGPLIAGLMRKMAWHNVFYANAVAICFNFLLLVTYREPDKEMRLAREARHKESGGDRRSLAAEALRELRKVHVWTYLAVLAGFWFMFNSLFDVLPAHIDDWVDSHDIVATLFGTRGAHSPIIKFFVVLNKDGTEVQPEGMVNLNAGLIMTTCFLFAYLSGKMRATTSMIVGTLLASVALIVSGYSVVGWVSLGAIALFSVGEMLSSPKQLEFFGNMAPADRKAMYMGFAEIPLAIGWTLEGKVGPALYDHFASKERFAREMLAERGLDDAALAAIPQGEAFGRLVALTGQTSQAVTRTLYAAHHVGVVWYIMGAVGIVSAVGLAAYARWIIGAARPRVVSG